MIIKVLLIAALVAGTYVLSGGPGTTTQRALRRLAALLVLPAGVTAVLLPDAVTVAANAVGVTRGADLVFYGAVATGAVTIAAMAQRIAALERQLTHVCRTIAITHAHTPDRPDTHKSCGGCCAVAAGEDRAESGGAGGAGSR